MPTDTGMLAPASPGVVPAEQLPQSMVRPAVKMKRAASGVPAAALKVQFWMVVVEVPVRNSRSFSEPTLWENVLLLAVKVPEM